jgi:hypothetical protein
MQKVAGLGRGKIANCEQAAGGRRWDGESMFAKDFIAGVAFVALVAWAMTDVLVRIRTRREQHKPKR